MLILIDAHSLTFPYFFFIEICFGAGWDFSWEKGEKANVPSHALIRRFSFLLSLCI